MFRFAALFGIAAGAIILLYSMILFAIMGDFSEVRLEDLQTAEIVGYLRYLILLVSIVLAMVAYRRRNPGPIAYRTMLGIGSLVAVVAAVFVGLLELVYVMLNPDFFEHYGRLAAEAMRANGATAEDIRTFERHQKDFAWMRNPIALGAFYFVETALIGTAMALVGALFTKRTEPESALAAG